MDANLMKIAKNFLRKAVTAGAIYLFFLVTGNGELKLLYPTIGIALFYFAMDVFGNHEGLEAIVCVAVAVASYLFWGGVWPMVGVLGFAAVNTALIALAHLLDGESKPK